MIAQREQEEEAKYIKYELHEMAWKDEIKNLKNHIQELKSNSDKYAGFIYPSFLHFRTTISTCLSRL